MNHVDITSEVRVYLLGMFNLTRSGRILRLPSRKDESLLAYLLLHPGAHSREAVAALFWPDGNREQSRASLRNALAVLRRILGQDVVIADRDTIQVLQDQYWVDALIFKTQMQWFQSNALPDSAVLQFDLYRGDLLEACPDEWLIPIRESYRQLYFRALLQAAQRQRSFGHYDVAIALAERILERESTDEMAHQLLMSCYEAVGDRQSALKQFELLRARLWDELATEPQPETMLLYQRIRSTRFAPQGARLVMGNLPTPLTRFIGRKVEVHDLEALICEQSRLVTLTGAGGAGKTRLAIEVADVSSPSFPDGVWWVELTPYTEARLLPYAVAAALHIQDTMSADALQHIVGYLRDKRLLLLLDNCEHLIEACASFVDQLLTACPHLRIMATSREALRIHGEVVWVVLPLSLPDVRARLTLDTASQSEAVRVFLDRAAAAVPGFHLNENNLIPVVEICRQMEGMPLALELAAVCVRNLPISELVKRLQDRFALLMSGSRVAQPRQQTLQATLDWSYNLLDDDEQHLFGQLAVFAGGFTAEAVEMVCGAAAVTVLLRLVEKSLVNLVDSRYHMLEIIRQYAHTKAHIHDDAASVAQRHLEWCVALVEQAEVKFSSTEQSFWSERLDTESANLRAALKWALEQGTAEIGLRLVSALWWFWSRRGFLEEIGRWLEAFLQVGRQSQNLLTTTAAKALARAGAAAVRQTHYETGRLFLVESMTLYRSLGEQSGQAFVLHQLGWLHHATLGFAEARELYHESLNISRQRGVDGLSQLADTLAYLGLLACFELSFEEARAYLYSSRELKSQLGDVWGCAFADWIQGNVIFAEGDHIRAKQTYQTVLRTVRGLHDRWGLPSILEGIAYVQAISEYHHATLLLSAASAIRLKTASPMPPVFSAQYERMLNELRRQYAADGFEAAWREGAALSIEDVITLALDC